MSTWTEDVTYIIEDLPKEFTLGEVYAHIPALAVGRKALTPENTIRRVLQELRDSGIIEFLNADGTVAEDAYTGSGRYRKLISADLTNTYQDQFSEEHFVSYGAAVAAELSPVERALFLVGFSQYMAEENA